MEGVGMKKEIKQQIENLIREHSDSNVVAVSIFVNCEGAVFEEDTRKDGDNGASWMNLRGGWVS